MRATIASDNLIDLLIDMVCVVDETGNFVFVSAASERLLGYTPDELIGTSVMELVHPEDRERTLCAVAEIIQGQWQTNLENRYIRKDGRVVDIMWSARWSPEERVRVAVARDVTERKRAERVRDALYLVSEAAHETDTLLLLYERLYSIIGKLLPTESFTVALYDESDDTLTFPYSVGGHALETGSQAPGWGARIDRVIRAGEVLHSTGPGLASTTGEGGDSLGESGEWLGVPLRWRDRVMGALVLESRSEDVRYTEDDLNLLEFVATQVAVAIERKRTEVRLQHRANHDALTGLPGRTLFQDRCDMALRRARREGEQIALLYLDIDDFKPVNDTYGHEAGDKLLCAFAQRLSEQIRDFDTVARIGGDEFIVLLGKVSGNDGVARVVDRIHAAIGEPFDLLNEHVTISVSIGAAVFPEEGESREELIRKADADMYAGKQQVAALLER